MKKKILVIDDDPTTLHVVAGIITSGGEFEVIESDNPALVLELVELHHPVAVVTDTNMSVTKGIRVLRTVKERYPMLPVVLLFSGLHSSPMTVDDVLCLGAVAVISKPEALFQLRAVLGRLVL